MHSTFATTAAIATFVASALAATDCNPSYNVPASTACYTACNVKNGQKWVPGWTMDHKSEKFLDSLALMCNKSGPNYGSFMASAGMCMAGCAGDDPESFNQEFAGSCAWWNEHKNDKCTAPTTTTTTTKAASTTTAPATTKATTSSSSSASSSSSSSAAPSTSSTTSAASTSTTAAPVTTTATTTATTTVTAGIKTVTVTVSSCPTPTSVSSCKSGYRGKRNGRGPEGACCSHSNDCQESCIGGRCNTKKGPTNACISGLKGLRNGKGKTGFCCSHSDDCKEVCRSGVCSL